MRGLAREAGVSLGTLQNHFPTKEVPRKAVINQLIAPAELNFHEVSTADALMLELVRHRLASAVHRPGLAGRLLTDGSADGEVVLDDLVEATREGREKSRLRLEAALQLRRVDPSALMAVLGIALPALSASKNALHKLLDIDLYDDDARERLALVLVDILLHGLLPEKPRGAPEDAGRLPHRVSGSLSTCS